MINLANSTIKVQNTELLSVRIGEQEFALGIMSVREIRGWSSSTPLPHAPPYIKGMVNLRGLVVAIVDLAERLGLPTGEPTASSVVVVAEIGDQVVGLLVDAVCDIITVTDDMIQPSPSVGSGPANEAVQGLVILDGRIVSVIRVDAILPKSLSADLAA
ncbi:MAG: chemotaxis protein CheW [Caulobacteraceae bacterium]